MKIKIGLFFLFCYQSLFACDCKTLDFQAALDSANIVFVGQATEVTTNWMSGGWKATFVVENSWKMPTEGILVVNTPWEKDCGFIFEVGKKYLVYANKKFTTKTTICSRTRLLSEAGEDLQVLGKGMRPASKGKTPYMIALLSGLSLLGLIFLAFVVTRGRNKKHKPVG